MRKWFLGIIQEVMMFSIRTIIILSLLVAVSASAADYFPLKEGNQWTYTMSNGMQTTTKIVGFTDVAGVRCAIAETTVGWQTSREYLAADAEGLKAYMTEAQGQQFRYDPPVLRIKLPYQEGDTWQGTVNQLGMTLTTSFQTMGREHVQTPAGAFDAIKVRSSVNLPGQQPMISVIYYADGVGPVHQVMQMAGQEITASLASTNVKPAQTTTAAPTSQAPAKIRCPKCGALAEAGTKFCASCGAKLTPPVVPAAPTTCPKCNAKLPVGAKFCPACGEKIEAPAAAPQAEQPPPATTAAPAPNQPALEKYQSGDGKVLVYRPANWTVTEGEMFGPGIYAVSVMEPQEDATVLFLTFPVDATVKDSVVLAAKCTQALRQQFPDLKLANMNSTPDRQRTIAELTLTAEGEKGTGHSYFFHSQNVGTVYFLLARADKWDEFRPMLTTIAANLAYAPQGVTTVVKEGQKLAEQAPAAAGGAPAAPAAMLQWAAQQPGKQVALQSATLPDQSMSIQIPQGWVLKGQRIQFAATSSEQTSSHGLCSVYHTIMPVDFPVQGVLNVRYQPPAQALETALQFGKLGRDVQVLGEAPTETVVPELAESIQYLRNQGQQVDSRLMHVRFTNVLTGGMTRALFVVQCNHGSYTPVWQLSVNGCWAPDSEFDEWLPTFLRISKTVQINQQWLQGELRNQAAAQQRLFNNLQKSIAESNQAFDSYMESVRDGSRSRDYISHMWSQTTLGQGSWVAENEGAKVYHTDSWGIEGPEGRIDSPAYNTTNFTGRNPWTGRDMELIDTRAEYERYIANQ